MEEGSRWTCEACGCNTNSSTDTNCGICGTSQSGPSILRRSGYSAARAAWLARPRGRLDDIEDEHDLWESVVHGINDELILDGTDRGRFVESTRQRFLDAARAFANRHGAESGAQVDPDELWESASSHSYGPYWMSSSPNEIQVGEGPERRHLAHVPAGAGEGQAVRVENPLPRNSTVGFRVAFEHPTAEVAGANMGGCYLVGVTTGAFSAWNENKGLQNSPFFFGIEDGGLVYEGSSRSHREAESSSQNSHGVLFGARDVVTCITEGRSLTFWRNDTCLGTLVNSLPRSVPLYPVVVPFNSEVTVAVTNVDSDPLPILQTFAVDWKKVQQEKDDVVRLRLAAQRAVLIQEDGSLTAMLRQVLSTIYDMYGPHHDRLWYRCGWKLAKLEEILQGKDTLSFDDFCGVIEKVIMEDSKKESGEDSHECSVGDKVELVHGYEKFGDAKGGPLQVGDRGVVVDIQRGQNGEQRSIRVLHNGRRWYYQPQAIRSERSGLIESTPVWFLRDILRSHGFDHTTLESLEGKPVTETSWRVGDVVVPKTASGLMGRIVGATKEPDSVKVQFASPSFADAVGLPSSDPLELWRVKISRLKHSTVMDAVMKDTVMEDGADLELSSNTEKARSDVTALSRFERIDIDSLVKECRRSSDSLASLFAGGLPDSFLSALTVAERLMNSLEPPDDLAERVSSIGDLAIAIAEQLFGDPSLTSKTEASESSLDSPDTDPSTNTRERARLAYRNRRLRLIRETGRRGEDEIPDRRRMLLSLVSRGSRRGGGPFLNEDRPIPNLLGSPGDLFGDSWDVSVGLQNGSSNAPRTRNEDADSSSRKKAEDVKDVSFLDSLLRCRGDASPAGVKQGGTADHHSFVRQLVLNGIIADNVEWAKVLIEAQSEKTQRRIPAILRSIVDEEGSPLLLLAVTQRCSAEMIGMLLDWGAPSRLEEVRKAAQTNQPESLRQLLGRTPLHDVELSVSSFSPLVQSVFEQSKVRQLKLEKAMADTAGKFMVDMLRKLLQLAICSRRSCSEKIESCGQAICEILVGNVLLSSVQNSQKDAGGNKIEQGEAVELGGLLGVLPRSILADCLLSDHSHVKSYLMVAEEYLCSKEMSDIASGLTILLIFLRSFPHLVASPALKRFGFEEFVAGHHSLAAEHISKIVSKRTCAGGKLNSQNTIMCPKSHSAVLHITRHSSFRCDLCGNGVDRGRPMHGCRQCDWDACEKCTDELESGLVKRKALKDLSTLCQEQLAEEAVSSAEEDTLAYSKTMSDMSLDSYGKELEAITQRLEKREASALGDLAALLTQPGSVTIHEFTSIVLPSLHSAFVRREYKGVVTGSRHSKKAKFAEIAEVTTDDEDDFLEFCRESLEVLVADSCLDQIPRSSGKDHSGEKVVKNIEADAGGSSSLGNVKVDISFSGGASELLRRLHQVLSFSEGVLETTGNTLPKSSDLQALKKPIELQIAPSNFSNNNNVVSTAASILHVEPLVPMSDIYRHVVRSFGIIDEQYLAFCRRLSHEQAFIVERPSSDSEVWRVAKVLSFDEGCGAHTVQYATSWSRGANRSTLSLDTPSISSISSLFRFSGPNSALILAARHYFVLCRMPQQTVEAKPTQNTEAPREDSSSSCHAVGTRVESDCDDKNGWTTYTVAVVEYPTSSDGSGSFVLVSDDGVVFKGVSSNRIRIGSQEPASQDEGSRARRPTRASREGRSGLFPFFAARERGESSLEASTTVPDIQARAIKRSWSALSLVDEMRPVDLDVANEVPLDTDDQRSALCLTCALGDAKFKLIAEASQLEAQPEISISFSSHAKLPGLDLSDKADATLVWVLKEIYHKQEILSEWPPKSPCALFFHLQMEPQQYKLDFPPDMLQEKVSSAADSASKGIYCEENGRRSRKLSSRSLTNEDKESESAGCHGFGSTCVKCMEVLSVISECAQNPSTSTIRDGPKLPGFANSSLSRKLTEQLDDPVGVIGGALPDWCLIGPSFAPCVFSYDTRRSLLERAAFGVSRSTLKLQNAKVNVDRLRQRMASLRSKAVELVGEAFSGGAEDPTALQLQADELYGMEEALSMKVRAAFRSQNWQEHSLQVAKVAVRREQLLLDASSAMKKYSTDRTVKMRRLEVRFAGESGFDAASGDEAGVTRGFYADCAEALLSAENVAGVYCSSSCLGANVTSGKDQLMVMEDREKLPLWIPDMDTSNTVIIPTPRASKRSTLGVFPRPLPHYHPQHNEVINKFRLMGRLFAAAMRDGFMFPLPLSSSFLKLVQECGSEDNSTVVLCSDDLPRPGFLGGEVYAAASTVCKALDDLDGSHQSLSRVQLMRQYEEVASNKNFARRALAKRYDCSFAQYFQDRTFVDPFDPGQGVDATPLCHQGASKPVTIYNIREWVALAKHFILHEGVLAQARAFRSGIEDFFSAEYLKLFTAEELKNDVCGQGDQVDNWDEIAIRKLFKLDGGKGAAEALVAVAAIGGEGGAALSRRFGPSSPTIEFLVNALKRAAPIQRRQFLSFVTSVPIVTPGNIEVVPILSPSGEFIPMNDPCCLPRANTCTRRLYLPKFDDFDSFEKVLWAVVGAENRFKGFWEWSG